MGLLKLDEAPVKLTSLIVKAKPKKEKVNIESQPQNTNEYREQEVLEEGDKWNVVEEEDLAEDWE